MKRSEAVEILWLAEVSHPSFHTGRGFWTGESWGWDALKAARFTSKDAAKRCVEIAVDKYLNFLPNYKIEICSHIFNCDIEKDEAKILMENKQ